MPYSRSLSRCPPAAAWRWRGTYGRAGRMALAAALLSSLAAAPASGFPEGRRSAGGWPSLGLLAAQEPHPAVVRVVAAERQSLAQGSGALVAVSEQHGLVLTNWHVVRDAAGPIAVVFPDGFQSAAQVLKLDRDWDLAALLIWRPYASPIPLAKVPPKPGDMLTIAGYGSGKYRAVSGRCTQYVAPGVNMPYEMVELSAAARQGDSGGPILNDRGEIAGVLFGSAGGTTSGSYCGRVRSFLASLWPDLDDAAEAQPSLPATVPLPPPPAASVPPPPAPLDTPPADIASPPVLAGTPGPLLPSHPPLPHTSLTPDGQWPFWDALPAATAMEHEWARLAGNTPLEQGKTVLAGIGLLALLLQFSRWLSTETKSEAK